ncbi:MAG: LacI family DNA-binding transcriptional regulator [Bacteroidota bacterium]
MKKVGIKDIARETNLSISTVSRVMNGKAEEYRISKKTQEIIIETAKRLDYNANHAAANLRFGKSYTIALLIPTLSNPFFARLASEINDEFITAGYSTILGESGEDIELEKNILKTLISRDVDGLMIVPCSDSFEHILRLRDKELPIVCIDRYFENLDIPYVSTDNYKGSYMATQLLIENGHKHILAIQGVKKSTPNNQRLAGFKAALKEEGINTFAVAGNDFTVQNGYLETRLALQKVSKPTAILAFSNTIALGCLKAIKEKQLNVPEDVSLICFDDHPYLDFLSTPLTCVVQPETDIARLSARFLFANINKTPLESDQVLLEPSIRIRDSIKKI